MDISQLLETNAQRYGDHVGVVHRNRSLTFLELHRLCGLIRGGWEKEGWRKGDVLAVHAPNSLDALVLMTAALSYGLSLVPLDALLKPDEVVNSVKHAEARCLVTASPETASLARDHGFDVRVIDPASDQPQRDNDWRHWLSERIASVEAPAPNDLALIFYTSGSTGRPKGVRLLYRHLQAAPEAMRYFVDLSDQDVTICAIPLSHIGGFVYLQNLLAFGTKLVLMDRFSPIEFLRLIETHGVTCFHTVPAMYAAMLAVKDIGSFDLSRLRWVVVFGAPSSVEMLKRFQQHCPNARLLNGWGMTETCPPNTVTPMDSDRIASVGKPAPWCRIKIVNENGGSLPAGAVGEIMIASPYLMDGYHKDPEMTHAVLKDGWLATGDLGYFDEDGFLFIVGRKKDMIKVGGQIVFPAEIEEVLCADPVVVNAAVIGVPHALKGEIPIAFVEVKPGTNPNPHAIRERVKERLASFKVPQSVIVLDRLPLNRTGKIDKPTLKQCWEQQTVSNTQRTT